MSKQKIEIHCPVCQLNCRNIKGVYCEKTYNQGRSCSDCLFNHCRDCKNFSLFIPIPEWVELTKKNGGTI